MAHPSVRRSIETMDALLPDHRLLGPDPEPFGQRFERLAGWQPSRRQRVLGPPRTCPLAAAFGEHAACTEACAFFCVPGARYACAVDEWSPHARDDQSIAAWFLDFRERAASG